ncbi:unnamed protein product [Lasius platythorax]
MKMITDI